MNHFHWDWSYPISRGKKKNTKKWTKGADDLMKEHYWETHTRAFLTCQLPDDIHYGNKVGLEHYCSYDKYIQEGT